MLRNLVTMLRAQGWVSMGIFGLMVSGIVLLVLINASWVNRFRNSAMQFVPAEAVSFVVIPNVRGFLSDAVPSILSIATSATGKNQDNFLSMIATTILSSNNGLPSPCTDIRDLADLQRYGIDPEASFSAARLDTGSRMAVKFSDPRRGLAFLADELSPIYIRLRVPKSPQPSQDDTGSSDTPTFHIVIDANNVAVCPYDDKRKVLTGRSSFEIAAPNGEQSIPIRLSAYDVHTASLSVTCSTKTKDGNVKSCECELSFNQFSDLDKDQHNTNCTKQANLTNRLNDITRWEKTIGAGGTAQIGNFFVAAISTFEVIEQVTKPPHQYHISKPSAPLDHDDSILAHFRTFEQNGRNFKATIYAGGRPDWITSISMLNLWALPLYLLTPIGIHFGDHKVQLEFISNLEPQDTAVVKALSTRTDHAEFGDAWETQVAGFGGAMRDNSMKLYITALRNYDPAFEIQAGQQFPFVPTILDIMERVRSIIVSVRKWNRNTKTWELAFIVPNITPEYATSLVNTATYQNIKREGEWVSRRAAALASEIGYDPSRDDFKEHVTQLTCQQHYWKLNTIHDTRGDAPTSSTNVAKGIDKFFPNIEIDTLAIDQDARTWNEESAGQHLHQLAPSTDANISLWGLPNKGGGFIDVNTSEVSDKLTYFLEAFVNVKTQIQNLNESRQIIQYLSTALPDLIRRASELESQREAIKQQHVVAYLTAIQSLSDGFEARKKFSVADTWGQFAKTYASMSTTDVKSFCEQQKTTQLDPGVTYYNAKERALYGFQSVHDLAPMQPNIEVAETFPNAENKFRFRASRSTINNLLNDDGTAGSAPDQTQGFPFETLRLTLEGRVPAAGVVGTIILESDGAPR